VICYSAKRNSKYINNSLQKGVSVELAAAAAYWESRIAADIIFVVLILLKLQLVPLNLFKRRALIYGSDFAVIKESDAYSSFYRTICSQTHNATTTMEIICKQQTRPVSQPLPPHIAETAISTAVCTIENSCIKRASASVPLPNYSINHCLITYS